MSDSDLFIGEYLHQIACDTVNFPTLPELFNEVARVVLGCCVSPETAEDLEPYIVASIPVMYDMLTNPGNGVKSLKIAEDAAKAVKYTVYLKSLDTVDDRKMAFEMALVALIYVLEIRGVSNVVSDRFHQSYESIAAEYAHVVDYPSDLAADLGNNEPEIVAEQRKLVQFVNFMKVMKPLFKNPRGKKNHLLNLIPRIAESFDSRYSCGGCQSKRVDRREAVYRHELGVPKLPSGKKSLKMVTHDPNIPANTVGGQFLESLQANVVAGGYYGSNVYRYPPSSSAGSSAAATGGQFVEWTPMVRSAWGYDPHRQSFASAAIVQRQLGDQIVDVGRVFTCSQPSWFQPSVSNTQPHLNYIGGGFAGANMPHHNSGIGYLLHPHSLAAAEVADEAEPETATAGVPEPSLGWYSHFSELAQDTHGEAPESTGNGGIVATANEPLVKASIATSPRQSQQQKQEDAVGNIAGEISLSADGSATAEAAGMVQTIAISTQISMDPADRALLDRCILSLTAMDSSLLSVCLPAITPNHPGSENTNGSGNDNAGYVNLLENEINRNMELTFSGLSWLEPTPAATPNTTAAAAADHANVAASSEEPPLKTQRTGDLASDPQQQEDNHASENDKWLDRF